MNRPNRRNQGLVEGKCFDSFSNLPLVEIVCNKRVLIEHHRGVLAYSCERIILRVRSGKIHVIGEQLHLAQMTGQKVVICGRIDAVQLEMEGNP